MSEAVQFWLRVFASLFVAGALLAAYMQLGLALGFLEHGRDVPPLHVTAAIFGAVTGATLVWRASVSDRGV